MHSSSSYQLARLSTFCFCSFSSCSFPCPWALLPHVLPLLPLPLLFLLCTAPGLRCFPQHTPSPPSPAAPAAIPLPSFNRFCHFCCASPWCLSSSTSAVTRESVSTYPPCWAPLGVRVQAPFPFLSSTSVVHLMPKFPLLPPHPSDLCPLECGPTPLLSRSVITSFFNTVKFLRECRCAAEEEITRSLHASTATAR